MKKLFSFLFNTEEKPTESHQEQTTEMDVSSEEQPEFDPNTAYIQDPNFNLFSLLSIYNKDVDIPITEVTVDDSFYGLGNMRFIPDNKFRMPRDIKEYPFSFLNTFDLSAIKSMIPTFILYSKTETINVTPSCFSNAFKVRNLEFDYVIPTFLKIKDLFFPALSFAMKQFTVLILVTKSGLSVFINYSLINDHSIIASPIF